MNLDEQLRAALNLEADMQDAPAHDVDQLIVGGKGLRRRRNLIQLGVAAAVIAVLVGVGVYGAAQIDSGDAVEPAQPAPTETTETTPQTYRDNNGRMLEPGTYRMLVGVDSTGVAIDADLTFESPAWVGGSFPVISDAGRSYGGLGIYRPSALAAGTGCVNEELNTEVAEAHEALAQQLAELPRSTVVQPPTPVRAFGHDAVHVQVRIDNGCGSQGYRVAETVRGSHGINYSASPKEVVIDFWVVDIDGVGAVVTEWHEIDAATELVDEIARTRDSIAFVDEE